MRRPSRLTMSLLSTLALALLLGMLMIGGTAEAQGSWTCTYDFTTGMQGWTFVPAPFNSLAMGLQSGSGLTHRDLQVGSATDWRRIINAQLTVASTTLTGFTVTNSTTAGTGSSAIARIYYNGANVLANSNASAPAATFSWSGSQAGVTSVSLNFTTSIKTSSGALDGSASITSITLQGTGTAPCNPPTPTPTNTAVPTNLTLGAPISITYITGLGLGGVPCGTYGSGGTARHVGCGWDNHVGPTTYTVPVGKVLVGWLTRIVSNGLSDDGDADVTLSRTVDGGEAGGWAYGANIDNGGINQNYVCGAARDVPGGTVPGWAWPGTYMCASFPAYTDHRHGSFYGVAGTVYTLGGGAQNALVSNDGDTVVFEAIPVLYTQHAEPTVDLTCPTGDLTAGFTYALEATTTGSVTSWAWDFGDGNTSTEADGHVEFSWVHGTYTVEVEVTGLGGTATDSCEITVGRVGDPGEGGGGALYRPLLSTDADTGFEYTGTLPGLISPAAAWGGASAFQGLTYAGADAETVIGLSQTQGAKVYSVADGTVLSVELLSAGECDLLTSSGLQNGVICQSSLYGEDVGGDIGPYATMELNTAGLYKVTMSFITGVTLEYYVANAPLYVREGQELLAGCILGETTPYQLSSNTPGVPNQTGKETFWMQAVTTAGLQVPILAQLYVDPDPATACNAGGEYSDCLFDPLFQDQGAYQWTVQGNVSRSDGFTLAPGSSISLERLTLDAATAYGFTVWTEYPSTYGSTVPRMTLSIGTTTTSFILAEHIRTAWSIAPATHTADQGSLYSIRITNSGPAPFTVLQNCVSNGQPNTTPGSCYFQNPTFDGQLTNWTIGGTVIPDPSGPVNGQIAVMEDLATIGQNVTLYADGGGGDHEYTVSLEGVLHGSGTSFFQVRYRLGGGGWITPEVTGWGIAEQHLTATQRTKTISFDLPSGTASGLLEFQFDFTATGSDVIGTSLWLSVYSLCLSDAAGWQEFPGGGGTGWTPGTGCDNSAPPVELQDDFGAWISYHLDGMSDIYYCDVIPQLEKLNNITYSIYEYSQWSGLYSQAVQNQVSTWADRSLFPWLGGYLGNIARAAGGAVGVDTGGGCHDLFCVLESLIERVLGPIADMVGRIVDLIISLVNTAVEVLLPLVEAIVGFFVQVIQALGSLLSSLVMLITAFVSGITNAQPAPVAGLPNCALDPSSNGLCAVMYGLENTIFADEGAAIIPLFIGILSIVQLMWLIGKIRELISEVTGGI